MTRPVRADDREAFELMTSSTPLELPDRLKRYRSDTFNDKYKRLPWDDLSRMAHRPHSEGRLLVHPSGRAPDADSERSRAHPDVP